MYAIVNAITGQTQIKPTRSQNGKASSIIYWIIEEMNDWWEDTAKSNWSS
jgi:hypothetical protein